jgi:hypothetical protein
MTQYNPAVFPEPASGPSSTPPSRKTGNGLGLASLIIGIVALVGAVIPLVNYVSGFVAFVGLVLGVIALFLKNRTRGTAIAGSVLNLVALILSIVLAVVYTAGLVTGITSAVEDAEASRASNSPTAAGPTRTLLLEVTGDAPDASISYATSSDLDSDTVVPTDRPLPFTQELQVPAAGELAVQVYSLTATNGSDDTGAITCRVTLDGEVISEQTGTGAFAAAFCTVTSD